MIEEIRQEKGLLEKYSSLDIKQAKETFRLFERSRTVLTAGNGTSYNAAYYLSLLFLKRGVPSIPVFSSEFSQFLSGNLSFGDTPTVIFSQSGETSDALAAARFCKQKEGTVISVCNVPGSTLPSLSDISFITEAGEEKSVAATKSHFAQLLVSLSLYFANQPDDYHNVLKEAAEGFLLLLSQENKVKEIAEDIGSRAIFLGSGFLYPVAREASLKMKETCSLVTDAYPMREFLHGPKQILDDSWDVFLLSQDNDVRAELSKLSRNVTDISDLLNSRFGIRIQDGLADSLVKVAFFQFLSYYKSVSLGLDPDKPSKLTKIISS